MPTPTRCRSMVPLYERLRGLRDHHVIVAGFGPPGRLCARQLEASGVNVTIVEQSADTLARQLRLNRDVVYGDIAEPAVLATAGVDRAAALILAIPDEAAALRACRAARELNPGLFIVARTNFMSQGLLCKQAGADEVVVEEVVTAQAMRQAVVEALTDEAR